MERANLISVQQFCIHYEVPFSFINELQELELIEVITVEETLWFDKSHIKEVEKMMRLHYDLKINLEGVDAIYNLLKQVKSLQEQIIILNNKLNSFHN